MTTFIQLIEFTTDDRAAVLAGSEEFWSGTEGTRTVRRAILAAHRDDPARHVLITEFDSYESAMANSALPETQASAQRLAAAAGGRLAFHDLEVLEVRS